MTRRYIVLIACLASACAKLDVAENTAIAEDDGERIALIHSIHG